MGRQLRVCVSHWSGASSEAGRREMGPRREGMAVDGAKSLK